MTEFSHRATMAYQMLCQQERAPLALDEIARRFGAVTGRPPPAAATISRWLSGDREPSFADVQGLAAVFGVSPGLLAFGEMGGKGTSREPAARADAHEDPVPAAPRATPRATSRSATAPGRGRSKPR